MTSEDTIKVMHDSESPNVREYGRKCFAALSKIDKAIEFRDHDVMVKYVFELGSVLFNTALDEFDVARLVRMGGKLTGAYVYLSQQSAYARAERDVFAQKAVEAEKDELLKLMHSGVKVTEARSLVSERLAELQEFVIQKDITKNQWENITSAVDKMVSFVQSAIRVKENEHFRSRTLQDNQG